MNVLFHYMKIYEGMDGVHGNNMKLGRRRLTILNCTHGLLVINSPIQFN